MARPISELLSLIREDWVTHDRDWTRPGFRAIAVYRFGVWKASIEKRLLRGPVSIVHRALFRRMRNEYGIELPFSAKIGRRVVFEHQGGVVVHGNATIGDDCIIRQGVTIGNRHRDSSGKAPQIGNFVNIGAGAVIIGAVGVGDRANVGANAVVISDVPSGATAVGVPARIILPSRSGTTQIAAVRAQLEV